MPPPPQERNTGAGTTIGTIFIKRTKSAQPNKVIVSIMPTLPFLPALPADLACYAYRPCLLCLLYIRNKIQPLNYSFVVGLKPH